MTSRFLILFWVASSTPFLFADRLPASLFPPETELMATLSPEEWSFYESRVLGRSQVLLEHQKVQGLRGIASTDWNVMGKGEKFDRTKKLSEICANLSKSFLMLQGRKLLQAGVQSTGEASHCRIACEDAAGRVTDQWVYLSRRQRKQESRIFLAHSFVFYYPSTLTETVEPILKFVSGQVKLGRGMP